MSTFARAKPKVRPVFVVLPHVVVVVEGVVHLVTG